MGIKLTKKQTEVVKFISEFIEKNGFSPSYRDIAAGLELSSVSAVAEHVENLVRIGALRKVPGAARSLEVVDTTYPETTELFKFRMVAATDGEKEILARAAEILGLELESPEETKD